MLTKRERNFALLQKVNFEMAQNRPKHVYVWSGIRPNKMHF